MILSFKTFRFDTNQQLLTEAGEAVALNDKATQLLSFFLQNAGSIVSKNDILDKVWSERVVSDQVVFQNISLLRSLFGADAIKTFPKKGYLWQLKITPLPLEESTIQSDASLHLQKLKPAIVTENKSPLFKPIYITLLACMICVVGTLILLNQRSLLEENSVSTTHFQQIYLFNPKSSEITLLNGLNSDQKLQSTTDVKQYLNLNPSQWFVASQAYPVNGGMALRFSISTTKRDWNDYIFSKDTSGAQSQLAALLKLLARSGYFEVATDAQALAILKVLNGPKHLQAVILQQQALLQFRFHEFDMADALLAQQLKAKNSLLRTGLLSLLKTDVNQWNQQWESAKLDAERAISAFQQLSLEHLEAKALIQSSWLYLVEQDFRQAILVLNRAIAKARSSGDSLLEVTAHVTQSFMASKSGQTELMYAQIDLATELLQLHQLDPIHHILIYKTLGWIANSPLEAQPHYEKILALPYSPLYMHEFYHAAAQLRDIALLQQDWSLAITTIKDWQRPSFQALAKAQIALAQNQWQQSKRHATEAFQLAQINQNKVDALDAALLLIQLSDHTQAPHDKQTYQRFIDQNATRRWISQNRKSLRQQ
ncbi:winged helix-turn-helix domain-containing protein [Pseudoalteromonas sp. T1lg65]|uniref:winged helix-turn-helix domain-containing protein n=1 Tax=Pseudoalteromonas sp. T1lg65 TaxID=2077101 RepID=UPI003F7A75B3